MSIVKLSKRESLSFMKVVYSILMRDDVINDWEKKMIASLCHVFHLSSQDEHLYSMKLYPNIEAIAHEFQNIPNNDTKVYLLKILWEVFKKDTRWLSSVNSKDRNFFKSLLDGVIIDEEGLASIKQIMDES